MKSVRGLHDTSVAGVGQFDQDAAGEAIVDGLKYLIQRLSWSGTDIAKVLHIKKTTLNNWIRGGKVPMSYPDIEPNIQLIIHLLAIHRSLEVMFKNPVNQVAWLSTFHPQLNAVPLEMMSESAQGLIYVRQYLDYIRGRGA